MEHGVNRKHQTPTRGGTLAEWGQKVIGTLNQGFDPRSAAILTTALDNQQEFKKRALALGSNAADYLMKFVNTPFHQEAPTQAESIELLNSIKKPDPTQIFDQTMAIRDQRHAVEVNDERVGNWKDIADIKAGEQPKIKSGMEIVNERNKDVVDGSEKNRATWYEGIQNYRQDNLIKALKQFSEVSQFSSENPNYAKDLGRVKNKIRFLADMFGPDVFDDQLKEEDQATQDMAKNVMFDEATNQIARKRPGLVVSENKGGPSKLGNNVQDWTHSVWDRIDPNKKKPIY